ncbi:MAG: type III pantothenate kinase [Alistipes sp.]|nr:type III pantothenate kinase [Alistipes sp.]
MANLIVDEGNSLCKIAVMDKSEVLFEASAPEFDLAKVAELKEQFSIDKAIVASTRGGAEKICEKLRSEIAKVLHFSSLTEVPIEIEYSSRQTLGADRIAVAVGVVCEMGIENALIVDMGSAITYDIVENGVFKGGNISLGVAMRFKALHDYTAALPLCQATEPNGTFGNSTVEAIEQGVMQGVLYEIEGYVEHISTENHKKSIIFCGGDAESFVNRIKNAIFAPRKLMFTGLNNILEYNVSKNNI